MDYERLSEIFKQYGSMTLSWGDFIEDQTLEKFFSDNVFEGTNCMLGELHDKTLERFGAIVDAFITHAGVNENDRQKLALMAVLYELLWDDVLGCWNDDSDIIRIEYNDEVLVNKPTTEVFEEYKLYLERIEGHVPSYESEDCDDEDWEDEDCDDEEW